MPHGLIAWSNRNLAWHQWKPLLDSCYEQGFRPKHWSNRATHASPDDPFDRPFLRPLRGGANGATFSGLRAGRERRFRRVPRIRGPDPWASLERNPEGRGSGWITVSTDHIHEFSFCPTWMGHVKHGFFHIVLRTQSHGWSGCTDPDQTTPMIPYVILYMDCLGWTLHGSKPQADQGWDLPRDLPGDRLFLE